jgi:hypothetical protein
VATVAEAAAARALEQRELDAELAEAGGEDIPENVRELMLHNTQYGGFDAETPTRRALQRFEVLSLSHGRFADLSQLAEMGALVEVNLNFNGVSSLAGLRECR